MGFFRGGLVLLLGILLFFSFLAMNSFFILSSSLKYDNVKEGLYPIVKDLSESGGRGILPEDVVGEFNLTKAGEDALRIGKFYCKNQNATYYVSSYGGYNINISCEDIINSTNSQSIIDKTYEDVIYDIYYKEYDCNFWDCFSKTELPFFLVSEKARDYWMEKFYFALISSLVLILLIFLFIEQKVNTPIVVGILLVLSSFPLLKLKDLLYFLAGKFSVLINLFLSATRQVFILSLIIGIALLAAGIALRLWFPDMIKKKLSAKDVREIVKDEISKGNQAHQKKKKK